MDNTKRNRSKKIIYVILFSVLLIAEILIGLLAEGELRNSGGDVLVVCAIYFLIRIFSDRFPRTLPLMIFAFACFVEWLQSMDICGILGIDKRSLLAILIGTNGNFFDVCCYFLGVLMIYTYMHFEKYLLFSPQQHKKFTLLSLPMIIFSIVFSIFVAPQFLACMAMISIGFAFLGKNYKSRFQAVVRTMGYIFTEFFIFFMGLCIGSMQDFVNSFNNH